MNSDTTPWRTAAYLLRSHEVTLAWVILYAATFAIAFVCAVFRGILAYAAASIALKLTGWTILPANTIALAVAYAPLAASLATLVIPLGGWWWEQSIGARAPSEREGLLYEDALAQLTAADPHLRAPRRWCIKDDPTPNAAAYADTLMITRGLLDSPHLTPVLAHELGHLNSSDARLTAALRRLTTPPRSEVRRSLRALAFLATGALAIWATRAPWTAYWRSREYAADAYAANLGQALPLSAFLDHEALVYDLPVPYPWLHDENHPPTELRIDRVEHLRATTRP
jgi:Zn-dependent protease with chaperone function